MEHKLNDAAICFNRHTEKGLNDLSIEQILLHQEELNKFFDLYYEYRALIKKSINKKVEKYMAKNGYSG